VALRINPPGKLRPNAVPVFTTVSGAPWHFQASTLKARGTRRRAAACGRAKDFGVKK
jgi:hypothetical protein